jgi:hypothetical protein
MSTTTGRRARRALPLRRLLLAGTLAAGALGSVAAPVAEAQRNAPTPQSARSRLPRKLLFTGIGAAVGSLAGGTYVFASGQSQPGNCASPECVFTVSVIAGGFIGYLIGREYDELHAVRYRGGTPLHPKDVSATLPFEPIVLSVRGELVAVGGSGGVNLYRSGASLSPQGRRAQGVKGISTLDLAPGGGSDGGALALGATSGLYMYPPKQGPGTLVRDGVIAATAAGPDRVYFATGSRVEVAPLNADTLRGWPGVDLRLPVREIELDVARSVVWAVTDSFLVALRPVGDSLEQVSTTPLPAGGRRMGIGETRLAITFGEGGVRLFDVTNVAAPRMLATWTGARFAYDVALAGTRMFVAAGPEGLYVTDVSGGAPIVLGLARELGFTSGVAVRDKYAYVLDRNSKSVRRITADFATR